MNISTTNFNAVVTAAILINDLLIVLVSALNPWPKGLFIPAAPFLSLALFKIVSLDAFAAASNGPESLRKPGISPNTLDNPEKNIEDLSNLAASC